MSTQEEMIVWHKYPDEVPAKSGKYLIELLIDGVEIGYYSVSRGDFRDGESYLAHIYPVSWAEMPIGWRMNEA